MQNTEALHKSTDFISVTIKILPGIIQNTEMLHKNTDSLCPDERKPMMFLIFPDFVNAYPKNHQRIEVRYVDAVS